MANTWIAEVSISEDAEEVDAFRSTDFDPAGLWEAWGWAGPITVLDRTDGRRPVCIIEERDGKAWVQPFDRDGNPQRVVFH